MLIERSCACSPTITAIPIRPGRRTVERSSSAGQRRRSTGYPSGRGSWSRSTPTGRTHASCVGLTHNGITEPAWSPDGRTIAYEADYTVPFRGPVGIFEMDADGSNERRVIRDFNASWPVWSPNGSKLAYLSNQDIWIANSDGSGQRNLTRVGDVVNNRPAVSGRHTARVHAERRQRADRGLRDRTRRDGPPERDDLRPDRVADDLSTGLAAVPVDVSARTRWKVQPPSDERWRAHHRPPQQDLRDLARSQSQKDLAL